MESQPAELHRGARSWAGETLKAGSQERGSFEYVRTAIAVGRGSRGKPSIALDPQGIHAGRRGNGAGGENGCCGGFDGQRKGTCEG